MDSADLPGLRGRDQAVSALRDALRDAFSGRSVAALVTGSAGIGKSRVVAELARHAREAGATVLVGTAVDIADAPPFWPVLGALRHRLRHEDGEVAELLRGCLDAVRPGGADDSHVLLMDVLYRLVVDLAAHRPVLLVVEDLQWADRSTRDLLLSLIANLDDEPVLVVATVRTDSPGRTPEFQATLAEIRRMRHVTALELQPLPRQVVAELLADWAPGRPDLEELVWERSAGNPFIAEETARAILAGDSDGIPTTLREIVLGRLELLSPAARLAVRALAVGVGALSHETLAAVLGPGAGTLHEAMREAVAHGVVVVDDAARGYRLRHGLLVDVVAGDLLPGERSELHRRMADALASDAPASAELSAQLAHHLFEAGDVMGALQASAAAARAAESVHAYAEAHRHWLRTAELAELVPPALTSVRADECLDRAARSAALAGDHDDAVALIEQLLLRDPHSDDGLAAALLTARAGSSLAAAGHAGEAQLRYRDAALRLPVSGAERERAQVLAGYSTALLQGLDFAGARSVARKALGLARTAAAVAVEARVLAVLGFSSAYLEDAEAGAAAVDEALVVAQRTGEPETIGEAYLRRAELMAGPLNRLTEGVDFALQGVAQMRELGLVRTAGVALLTYAANAHFRLGHWDAAERVIADAWALGPTGAAAVEVRLARIRLLLGRGELQAAAADLEAVDLLVRAAAGPRHRIPLLVLFAALELWRQEPAAAMRHVETGLAVAEHGADDIWSLAPLIWHGTRAWADLVTTGHPAPAQDTVQRLDRHRAELARRARHSVPAVRAVVEAFTLMCAAEVARAQRTTDAATWARLVTVWEAHQQPYPAAYARLRHAEALLDHGSRGAAVADALRAAGRAARDLGANPLLDDVIDLATRGRIALAEPAPAPAPAPAVPTGPRSPLDELTVREMEVLTELAEGRTNREIAQRLYISDKTVGVHVSRIFAKIGVHSRMQASAVLLRSRRRDGS